ncbi:MAG: GTPase Era [Lachnospiraceae bacterium]|nr:GTPase Era [Lachnospiraceae bacterium]MCR5389769.1 GTPase Era [Lachnospiraceae bacterium]
MSENKKAGFCVLAGRPNVGKSTLMNRLIGTKIAITSPKPQTTRNSIRTVYTDDRGQAVFIDTPGIHKSKNRLSDYMMAAVGSSMKDADLILWLVEPKSNIPDEDRQIAERIKGEGVPVFLVINKIDTVKKPELLKVIDAYKDLCSFKEIIPVSALKQEGLEELMSCIFDTLPEGPAFYPDDELTDEPMRHIAAEIIREKALLLIDKEIPHGIAVMIDRMEKRQDKDMTDIEATIVCEKESHKGIIIGKKGVMLRDIGMKARPEIERLIGTKVYLQLWVKVKENWRDSDVLVANFGYRKDQI